ncbi:MAG: hypothetical protein HOK52_12755 [Candidatus Marinimicrobia bacterium]|jgi:LPS sulfotransferase NodH|nr:hypothetical protein [Candidatus Neomarinimicrobiota bacterium]MBT3960814.1 hypothetical protein [Candidatus Neomarinimicrobiota bacterium]MBT4634983.1 hypothetical protein [Candidatus Neomarinimicrobiota bacterium]MBT4684261.1 hypothetical protein [Candidatus Neomarinimicrobiota bacterium]MBT4735478.1 hypothetical protein [Candidatus Neomarinimicrobiota bacterium]
MINELKRIFKSYYYSNNYKKFVIVGHARTGSNFLANLLRSSEYCRCVGEVFAEHRREYGKGYDKIIKNVFGEKRNKLKAVGFKLFYYHLTKSEWLKLSEIENLFIIHLIRRNTLRTIVSLEIAFQNQYWFLDKNTIPLIAEQKRIKIDTNTIIDDIDKINEYQKKVRKYFKNNEIDIIYYEDMVQNPQSTIELLRIKLGLDKINYNRIISQKQNPESIKDLIINYKEVEDVLNEKGYSSYLE